MTARTSQTLGPAAKSAPASASVGRQPLAKFAPWIALLCLVVIFTMLNGNFFSVRNGVNILQQASVLAVLSLGVTFVIVMGSIDLSIGSIVSMAGMVGAYLVRDYGEWAVLLAPVAAAAVGGINGVLFAYARLPSFLTTLGMLFAINGMTLYMTEGSAIGVAPDLAIAAVFNGSIFGIPTITLWAVAALLIAMFAADRTRFGRYLFAIGGGEAVAQLCGVPVARFKFYAFVVSGFLAGVAAILLMLRISGSDPAMGTPLLLPAIAAVVMGGTPLTGGVGGPYRTVLGVLIITVLQNGMNLANVNPFLQDVVLGAGVIAAVAINMDRNRRFIVK